MSKVSTLELLSQNYLIVNRTILAKLGPNGALLLSLLIDKWRYWNSQGKLEADGSFYKVADEIQAELGIGEKAVSTAQRELMAMGLIAVVKRGMPAKNFFLLSEPAILSLISSGDKTSGQVPLISPTIASDDKTSGLVPAKHRDKSLQNVDQLRSQTKNTDNTPTPGGASESFKSEPDNQSESLARTKDSSRSITDTTGPSSNPNQTNGNHAPAHHPVSPPVSVSTPVANQQRVPLASILKMQTLSKDRHQRGEEMRTCIHEIRDAGYSKAEVMSGYEKIFSMWAPPQKAKYRPPVTREWVEEQVRQDLASAIKEFYPVAAPPPKAAAPKSNPLSALGSKSGYASEETMETKEYFESKGIGFTTKEQLIAHREKMALKERMAAVFDIEDPNDIFLTGEEAEEHTKEYLEKLK